MHTKKTFFFILKTNLAFWKNKKNPFVFPLTFRSTPTHKQKKMSKRKGAFSFDDLDNQILKETRKKPIPKKKPKLETIDDDTKSNRSVPATTSAKTAKRSRNKIFPVKTNNNTSGVKPFSETLNTFDSLYTKSNKKSTIDLKTQANQEQDSRVIQELTLLQRKEKENVQKYQKKMDPDNGRFSVYDTEETNAEIEEHFHNEELQYMDPKFSKVFRFSEYEEDNIFFKFIEEEERERDNKYRHEAQQNVLSLSKTLSATAVPSSDLNTTPPSPPPQHPHQEYFDHPSSSVIPEKAGVSYCASFLREAKFQNERPCKKEENCVAKKMSLRHPDTVEDTLGNRGWICREFLLPSQQKELDSKNVLPRYRQSCLLCNRLLCTYIFKKNDRDDTEPLEIIQDHCNIVGNADNDGYPLETCLGPIANKNQKIGGKFTGITQPIRRFCAVDYVPKLLNILDLDNPGEWVEVRCFVELPLNFQIAPVVAIKTPHSTNARSIPLTVSTDLPRLE